MNSSGLANEPGSMTSRVSAGVAQRAGSDSEAIGTETGRQRPQPVKKTSSESASHHECGSRKPRRRGTVFTLRTISAIGHITWRVDAQGGVGASFRGVRCVRWAVANTWSQTPLVTP